MKVYKIFVDDRDYDNEDGFTLYSDNAEEIAYAIKIAVKNGFTDIRLSIATIKELSDLRLLYKTDFEINSNQ